MATYFCTRDNRRSYPSSPQITGETCNMLKICETKAILLLSLSLLLSLFSLSHTHTHTLTQTMSFTHSLLHLVTLTLMLPHTKLHFTHMYLLIHFLALNIKRKNPRIRKTWGSGSGTNERRRESKIYIQIFPWVSGQNVQRGKMNYKQMEKIFGQTVKEVVTFIRQ